MEMVTDYRLEDGDGFTLYGFEEEINLEQCDFSGMDFSGWSIGNVNFVASNMVGANFNDSYISQVNFEEALLTDATFENASIHNLLLKNAGLSGVDLSNTILTGPHAIALSSCPNMLPVEWDCLNDNLVGPTARLIDANLSNKMRTWIMQPSILLMDLTLCIAPVHYLLNGIASRITLLALKQCCTKQILVD
jgi:hypothetical protein